MNPGHLLEQAENLILTQPTGAPRQADLRRAISTAYYGVFHFVMAAAADLVLGKTAPKDDLYARVYRSLNHRELKDRSNDLRAIGGKIKAFIDAVISLQKDRHDADYSPLYRVSKSDALAKVTLARSAIVSFRDASEGDQKACLIRLMFKER